MHSVVSIVAVEVTFFLLAYYKLEAADINQRRGVGPRAEVKAPVAARRS